MNREMKLARVIKSVRLYEGEDREIKIPEDKVYRLTPEQYKDLQGVTVEIPEPPNNAKGRLNWMVKYGRPEYLPSPSGPNPIHPGDEMESTLGHAYKVLALDPKFETLAYNLLPYFLEQYGSLRDEYSKSLSFESQFFLNEVKVQLDEIELFFCELIPTYSSEKLYQLYACADRDSIAELFSHVHFAFCRGIPAFVFNGKV